MIFLAQAGHEPSNADNVDPASVAPPTVDPAGVDPAGAEVVLIDPTSAMSAGFPQQADLLLWCQNMAPSIAALLVLAGVVYLLWGLSMYRVLMTINAAIVGGYIGALIGMRYDHTIGGMIIGAVALAAFTIPLMKYAVSVQGGVLGALIGAAVWQAGDLDMKFAWSGALIGLVFCGMLSFIIFQISIILYTSVQGSAMLITGLLGLIYKHENIIPQINQGFEQPLLLPLAILVPAVAGLIFQQMQAAAAEAAAKKK